MKKSSYLHFVSMTFQYIQGRSVFPFVTKHSANNTNHVFSTLHSSNFPITTGRMAIFTPCKFLAVNILLHHKTYLNPKILEAFVILFPAPTHKSRKVPIGFITSFRLSAGISVSPSGRFFVKFYERNLLIKRVI